MRSGDLRLRGGSGVEVEGILQYIKGGGQRASSAGGGSCGGGNSGAGMLSDVFFH